MRTRGGCGGEDRRSAWRETREEQQKERGGDWPVKIPEGVELYKRERKGTAYLKLISYPRKDENHPDHRLGDEMFRRPYSVHKNLGPENRSAVCPKGTYGKRCPVCEEKERARARYDRDDEEGKKVIGALSASNRALYLCVDVEDDLKKLLLLDQPNSMSKGPGFGRLLEDEIDEQDASEPFPWDEDGPILKVRFGEDAFNKHAFYPAQKVDLEDAEKGQRVDFSKLGEIPSLDDCLNLLSYEALERLMMGADEEDEEKPKRREEPEEEEKPRSRRQKAEEEPEPEKPRGRTRKPEPEPEPPEDEGPDEDRIREALDEIADADHDDIAALAEEFDVELDAGDLKASKKGDKNARKSLRKELREALEEMLEGIDEPEPEKPKTGRTRGKAPDPEPEKPAGKKGKKDAAGDCPHGHEFGEDTDDKPECKKCDVWERCADEQDARKAAKKK
jgi:hypothetical protein